MPLLDLEDFYPLFTPFTPPNSSFDKRDSTKNLCFYAESSIKWFQRNAPQRLTSAEESVTIKARKGILPIDGQPLELVAKKVTTSFGRGRLLFCAIYVSYQNRHNDSKNHQNDCQQFIVTHKAIPPFPDLPVARGIVPLRRRTDRLSRYGSTPCEYIIRKCRTLQEFPAFFFSAC